MGERELKMLPFKKWNGYFLTMLFPATWTQPNSQTVKQSTGTDWLILGFRSKANSFAKNQRVNYLEKLFAFSFDVIAFL